MIGSAGADPLDEKAIFQRALTIESPEQRDNYLKQICGDHPAVLDRVATLLRMHDEDPDFLENPVVDAVTAVDVPGDSLPSGVEPGMQIGRYKLREQIGEGGMGVVYVAEQTEPVRRFVALKIVKPGMDSKEVLARFQAEKQVLALMDHPHVARVYDAGTAEQGRPYFVMELVRGFPITEYCDGARLDTQQRLQLFLKVCQGVQHAHLKGIIHRDLKPGNVLVTLYDGVPVPKVIDFGVAKALHQQLTDQTVYTQFRQMIGTPAYMSPEQAEMSGLDVDTRTDVYSLGVLLYELLTGTTPFDKDSLKSRGFDEMRRILREQEPPCPSQRITTLDAARKSTLQQQRGIDPRHLAQSLRRDLDWIVMKALEKDRTRRYESASALARDVKRYCAGDPVEACPPTSTYRLQKYARRHKYLLITSSLVILTALVGTMVSLSYARLSHTAAAQARVAAADALRAQETAEQHAAAADRADRRSRSLLYTADMKLASDAIAGDDVRRAAELLQRHAGSADADLRSFEWDYFHKRATISAEAVVPVGRWVDDLEVSPDGNWLAVTGPDQTVLVYDTANWTKQHSFTTGTQPPDCVAWSSDGLRLAAACVGGQVHMFDFPSGQRQLQIEADPKYATGVAFSPDGETLFTCGDDLTAKAWEVATGKLLRTYRGHQRTVECLAVSATGELLATGGADGALMIWDVQSGKQLHNYPVGKPGERIVTADFAFHGDMMTAANISGQVFLTNARTGTNHYLPRMIDGVEALTMIDGGTRLATADRSGAIEVQRSVFYPQASDALAASPMRWIAHQGRALSLAATPDEKQLISGGRDGVFRVWRYETFEDARWMVRPAEGRCIHSFAISSDDQLLTAESSLAVWDLKQRKKVADDVAGIGEFRPAGANWSHVVCSRDERSLAVVRPDRLMLVDLASQSMINEWPLLVTNELPSDHFLAISSDGKLVAYAPVDGTNVIKLFQRGTPDPLAEFSAVQCRCLAFSPDNRRLAAGTQNHALLFDLAGDADPIRLEGHSDALSSLAFTSNGELLATVGNDRLLKIWDVADRQCLHTIVADQGPIFAVAISPDDRTAVTAGNLGNVNLWHIATGQPLGKLSQESDSVHKLQFNAAGSRLAALLADSTVVVFDSAPRSAAAPPGNHESMRP